MNEMFGLFWTSLKELHCMLNWRNANSIKLNWNFLNILFFDIFIDIYKVPTIVD